MIFDWEDYFTLAKRLYELQLTDLSGLEAARFRSIVSRTYYSSYCLARNLAKDRFSYREPKKSNHSHLINFYQKRINDKKLNNIGVWLERLRDWRNKCDYQDDAGNVEKLAKSSLNTAEKIIKSVGQIKTVSHH